MARSLTYLYLAASAITLGSLLLPDAVERSHRGSMTAMGAIALLGAIVLTVGSDRLPRTALSLMLAVATVTIEWTIYASGESASPYAMYYVWVAIYAFYFLPTWQALAQLGFIAFAYAVALTLVGDWQSATVVRWAVTTSALIVAGAMIGVLKSRLDSALAEQTALTRTDPTTGLLNRRAFRETLHRAVELARRTGGRVSVAMGELPDTAPGEDRDRRLARAGLALAESLRSSDVGARVDERSFAVVAPGTGDHGGYVLAEQVQTKLCELAGESQPATFGVATFPDHASTTGELLDAVERALAEARALGPGRVVACGERTAAATAAL
jgi:diguanylate cyclase (GGDEF)-like protein